MKTRKLHAILATAVAGSLATASGATVAYWNFNTLAINTASSPGSGGVPTSIPATTGSGSLDLSGWTGTVDDFAGSTLNAQGGDPAGASLSLLAGSGLAGNGGVITVAVPMTGLSNPVFSFATQGTATGFTSNQFAWSINGTDFNNFGVPYAPPAGYFVKSIDLSAVDAVDGASTLWLRLSFQGASTSGGNNRLDNLLVDAIPEPSTWALMLGTGVLAISRRRRCHRPT